MKKTTSLVIDLSFSSFNTSIMAMMESFEIDFFHMQKAGHWRVSMEEKAKNELTKFLNDLNIPNKVDGFQTGWYFVHFQLDAQIYMQPNHHIELRASKN